jgi:hypothetical protein
MPLLIWSRSASTPCEPDRDHAGLSILGIQAALQPLIMASHEKRNAATIARLFEGFIGVAA